jgi:hypothetical protein
MCARVQVTILQGTVFTIKTSPEVSKSRILRLSADTENEVPTKLN